MGLKKVFGHNVVLRSVMDGHTITLFDDGYAQGDPDKMNGGRQRLVHTLRKKCAGGRVFLPLKPIPTFSYNDSDGNVVVCEPPDAGDNVWSDADDARLAKFQPARDKVKADGEYEAQATKERVKKKIKNS